MCDASSNHRHVVESKAHEIRKVFHVANRPHELRGRRQIQGCERRRPNLHDGAVHFVVVIEGERLQASKHSKIVSAQSNVQLIGYIRKTNADHPFDTVDKSGRDASPFRDWKVG